MKGRRARVATRLGGALAALGLALSFGGCVPGPEAGPDLRLGDADVFARRAQPALAAGCANPSCHGNADRPLETYAPFLHRLDAERLHLDEPLSGTELEWNRRRAAAFLLGVTEPDATALLRKPLGPDAGGSAHGGGVIYEDPLDPDYLALKAWVETALTPEGATP